MLFMPQPATCDDPWLVVQLIPKSHLLLSQAVQQAQNFSKSIGRLSAKIAQRDIDIREQEVSVRVRFCEQPWPRPQPHTRTSDSPISSWKRSSGCKNRIGKP